MPPLTHTQLPNDQWQDYYTDQLAQYRGLYTALKDRFANNSTVAVATVKQNLRKSS